MLAEERYMRIMTILKDRGFVRVDDLAQILNVSDMTIRRDLDHCQERGILQRCHGGALMNRPELSFKDKSGKNHEIKKIIAQKAASFVEEGMTVFLDAGTTTYEIARLIRDIPRLTIVTDDVHIMYFLLNSSVELICIGGVTHKKTGCTLGRFSEQMAEQMHFDISFIGTNVVDEDFCAMTPTLEKMFFKRMVLRHSGLCYLVADHSKFNKKALYLIDNLEMFSGVITDYAFDDNEQKLLSEKKITIIAVKSGELQYERLNT